MSDLVTICVPVYNGERYLKQCIDSAIKQTYEQIEILLVNDCSSDNSKELIEQYQLLDNRIRLVNNSVNLGLVGNWTQCLQQAKGDWIKFLFQDDFMRSDCVETMLLACKRDNKLLGICSREVLLEANANEGALNYFQSDLRLQDVLKQSGPISVVEAAKLFAQYPFFNIAGEPIVLLFHKALLKAVGGYNADLVQQVDYEFFVRASLYEGFTFVRELLVTFRVHSGATSNIDTLSAEKKMKRLFLEPVIMYHEYLFNSRFKLLRQQWTYGKELVSAAKFYGAFIGKYERNREFISATLKRYPKMNYIKMLSLPWQWVQKMKN